MEISNGISFTNIALGIYTTSYTGSFVFIAVFYWISLTKARPTEEYRKEECIPLN